MIIDAGNIILVGRNVTAQELDRFRDNYKLAGEYRNSGDIMPTSHDELYKSQVSVVNNSLSSGERGA